MSFDAFVESQKTKNPIPFLGKTNRSYVYLDGIPMPLVVFVNLMCLELLSPNSSNVDFTSQENRYPDSEDYSVVFEEELWISPNDGIRTVSDLSRRAELSVQAFMTRIRQKTPSPAKQFRETMEAFDETYRSVMTC